MTGHYHSSANMSEQNSFCSDMSDYMLDNVRLQIVISSPILYVAVHRFSPFVKVDAELYVLGYAVKKAPRIV